VTASLLALTLVACVEDAPVEAPAPPPAAPPIPVAVSPAPPATTPGTVWVAPGLVDAHAHPQGLGRHLSWLRLNDIPTKAATLEAIAQAASEGEGWLVGRGWDHTDWPDHDGSWPTAAQLDAITGDRPVALRRVDGHSTWVNSAALAAAGITAQTKDPEGGRILRDPAGEPSGILVDEAIALLPKQPEPSDAELRRQLEQALAAIAATGLTGVHDMGTSDRTLALYEALGQEGKLPVRIFAYLDPDAEAVARLKADGPWCGPRHCVVGVKWYADGSLGSRGALLSQDYADEPGHRGLGITDVDTLTREATALLQARAQLAVHAIGDEGVHGVVEAFAAARAAVPEAADVPLRLEHAQVVRPEDVARLEDLNIVASMQPTHATSDMPWAEARLGPDRVGWSYAWRDMLDAGALLTFGSDFPVEQVSPSYGLWSATTRSDLEGQPAGGWRMDQALSIEEAAAAFSAASYAALPPDIRARVDASGDRTTLVAEARAGGTWWTATETVVAGTPVWTASATGAP
jgi:predicted amidohydrolase YtcJ